jgi:hypothetical protein
MVRNVIHGVRCRPCRDYMAQSRNLRYVDFLCYVPGLDLMDIGFD